VIINYAVIGQSQRDVLFDHTSLYSTQVDSFEQIVGLSNSPGRLDMDLSSFSDTLQLAMHLPLAH